MTKIIAALLFGYLLIALEAIVPGGVLGLLGFVCLVASAYFAHLEYGGLAIPLIVFLVGGFGGVIIVFLQFRWLSGSKFGRNMFVHATSGKNVEPKNLDHLVGRTGIAETDHHPEGLIKIGNESYDSYCDSGFIPKGTELQITRIDSFRLIVEPL